MGVRHDHEPDVGLPLEPSRAAQALLAHRRDREARLVVAYVAEIGCSSVHQPEPEVGMQQPVEGRGHRMVDRRWSSAAPSRRLGQAVAVDGRDAAACRPEA